MTSRQLAALCLGWLCAGLLPAHAADGGADRTEDGWLRASPQYAWSFPRDHWSHPGYRSEWWYLTGHLQAADGRRFGYQFTFFRVGLLQEVPDLDSPWAARDLLMGHAALTDLSSGEHHFSEVLYRAMPLLAGFPEAAAPKDAAAQEDADPQLLAWCLAPAGTSGRWTLHFNGDGFDLRMTDAGAGFALDLSTTADKPLVFQGPGGYSAKAKGPDPGASQYYSFTRLRTSGHVVLGGDTLAVDGSSWMDKEFGSDKLAPRQAGWDWFSLQLADGRDIMLYVLRDADGAIDHASGTVIDAAGGVSYLAADEFAIESTATWTSPHTGAVYPSGWTLRVGDVSLVVRPLLQDQENVGQRVGDLFYWEGAVQVLDDDGNSHAGSGYVELTGYGSGRRPGI